MKEKFTEYIEKYTNASRSSKKYAGALNTISKILGYDLFKIISTPQILKIKDELSNNHEYQKINSVGHDMYYRALEYYIDFLSTTIEKTITILDDNGMKETVKEEREGEFVERRILSRKRNQEIVKQVKERDNYTCKCITCSFNYKNKIVQAHHLTPLSETDGEVVIKPDDLITLCPNCHSIAHLLLKEDPKYQNRDVLLEKLFSLNLTT